MNYTAFHISGIVLKGAGRGKKLGFPTLNLESAHAPADLVYGVYAAKVKIGADELKGVLHYGPRPTFDAPVSFEIHCLGLEKKLYGKRADVEIIKKIRAVKKFANGRELAAAIKKDILSLRPLL